MGFLRLFSKTKPKIKVESTKKDGFSGWVKCSHCAEMVHTNEMQENLNCCPKCDHHYRFSALQRIELFADTNTFQELFTDLKPTDPLNFVDRESYAERTKKAQEKSGRDEGIYTGTCLINQKKTALAVMDFSYMGGSMGSVVGEKLTRLIEHAIAHNLPLVIVSASGGARMQESCLSLMQMAKTSAALAKLHEKGLPYIAVLTNPTTGGVTASFASLGDIILAEPEALIGFAGPRIVEQTIRQKLPSTAQKSEFLLDKGMIDAVVRRADLKDKVSYFLEFFTSNQKQDLPFSEKRKSSKAKNVKDFDQLEELLNVANKKKAKEMTN